MWKSNTASVYTGLVSRLLHTGMFEEAFKHKDASVALILVSTEVYTHVCTVNIKLQVCLGWLLIELLVSSFTHQSHQLRYDSGTIHFKYGTIWCDSIQYDAI